MEGRVRARLTHRGLAQDSGVPPRGQLESARSTSKVRSPMGVVVPRRELKVATVRNHLANRYPGAGAGLRRCWRTEESEDDVHGSGLYPVRHWRSPYKVDSFGRRSNQFGNLNRREARELTNTVEVGKLL